VNHDVFDLTEDRIFSQSKKRNGLKTSYHHNLPYIFARFSFSSLEFLGKAHRIIDFDAKEEEICPKCGHKIKGLECHCDEVCDRCGAKLKFDENLLCKRCNNYLERDHNKQLFLREMQQR
jgi:NADH pyrophosphatase NudC (nudix superfamily)